jgi:LAS superfamily LD-carboxypeptidase LdcB
VKILSLYLWIGVLALTLASYGGYRYYDLNQTFTVLRDSNASLEYQSGQLVNRLKTAGNLNNDLKTVLGTRQAEKESMGQQVATLSATVGTLDKLTKTDKQLLEKYSSVYFLNENYAPQSLTAIDASYLNRPEKLEQFQSNIYPHLTDLLRAAHADHIPLQIFSAYRSFGTQALLKSNYKITYSKGTANSFSADQGYSEHQLGTTVDFTTPTIGSTLVGFDKSPAYIWLSTHAYLYGFILSYPKNNIHFIFEPWHWRYIGIELAKKLHDEGKSFYELDQREIDTYLIKFFD